MAYQNVGTPRFYVNTIEWLDSVGYLSASNFYRTLPVVPKSYAGYEIYTIPNMMGTKSFVALLGHNFKTFGSDYYVNTWGQPIGSIVNSSPSSGYDGFSISTFDGTDITDINLQITWGADIGSVVIGTYYDMPHSPDLNLTMSREYGGIKTIETKGGSSLSNANWLKPPNWGEHPAWELWDNTAGTYVGAEKLLSRSARRTWGLSFSYLQDRDTFGTNQMLFTNEIFTTDGYDFSEGGNGDDDYHQNGSFRTDLLQHDNFYSQVIHRLNGGQLAFVFQPDSNNNNPDQFAICKFDMNSYKFTQTAPGLYNVKLKIREVW